MAEPINLAKIKHESPGDNDYWVCKADVLLALVEAVEAARRYRDTQLALWAQRLPEPEALGPLLEADAQADSDLDDALARFEWDSE